MKHARWCIPAVLLLAAFAAAEEPADDDASRFVFDQVRTFVEEGNLPEAQLMLQDYIEQRSSDYRAWSSLAYVLAAQDKSVPAIDAALRSLAIEPNVKAYNNLILAYKQINLPELVHYACLRSLELDPAQFQTWMHKARAEREQGLVADAQKSYETARKLQPSDFEAPYELARMNLENGDAESAWSLLQEMKSSHPKEDRLLLLEAEIRSNRGEHKEAARLLEEYLSRNPINGKAAFLLGQSCVILDRVEEGIRYLETARSDPSVRQQALFALLQAYRGKGDKDKLRALQKEFMEVKKAADEADRNSPRSLRGEATRLVMADDVDGAEKICRDLLSRDENDPKALWILGYCLLRQGKCSEAWPLLERAEIIDCFSPDTATMAGLALYALGEVGLAKVSYFRSLLLDPAFVPAIRNLAAADLDRSMYLLRDDPDGARLIQEAVALWREGKMDEGDQLSAKIPEDATRLNLEFSINQAVRRLLAGNFEGCRETLKASGDKRPEVRFYDSLAARLMGKPDEAAESIKGFPVFWYTRVFNGTPPEDRAAVTAPLPEDATPSLKSTEGN